MSALKSLNCLHLKRKRKGLAILTLSLIDDKWHQSRSVRRIGPVVSVELLTSRFSGFSTRPVAGAADGVHRLPSDVLGD